MYGTEQKSLIFQDFLNLYLVRLEDISCDYCQYTNVVSHEEKALRTLYGRSHNPKGRDCWTLTPHLGTGRITDYPVYLHLAILCNGSQKESQIMLANISLFKFEISNFFVDRNIIICFLSKVDLPSYNYQTLCSQGLVVTWCTRVARAVV